MQFDGRAILVVAGAATSRPLPGQQQVVRGWRDVRVHVVGLGNIEPLVVCLIRGRGDEPCHARTSQAGMGQPRRAPHHHHKSASVIPRSVQRKTGMHA
jgi:hypothetical protein